MIDFLLVNWWWLLSFAIILLFILFGSSYQQQGRQSKRNYRARRNINVSSDVAVAAARACPLAYEKDDESLQEWELGLTTRLEPLGITETRVHRNSGRQAFSGYLESNGELLFVICVRGTQSFFQLLLDMWIWKTEAPPLPGRAHKGFYESAKFLWEACGIKERAGEAQRKGARFVFCGHSLGAAIAVEMAGICAGNIKFGTNQIALVLSLCSPRTGNWEHSNALEAALPIVRVVYGRDLVTVLPPIWLNYYHAGRPHYFDCENNYHSALTWGFRVVDVLCGTFRDWTRFKGALSYHSGKAVAELVERNISRFPFNK